MHFRSSLRGPAFSLLLCAVVTGSAAAAEERPRRPSISVESTDGVSRVWVDVVRPGGTAQRRLLRETSAAVRPTASGWGPAGRTGFTTWDEDGERWFSYSRDAGRNWSEARSLAVELRLRDGSVYPESEMPDAPGHLVLPPDGGLYIVQFKTISLPEWREAVEAAGAEIRGFLPNNAHIVTSPDARVLDRIDGLDVVTRIEPYHPWYRLSGELRDWLDGAAVAQGERMRVRVLTFDWGPEAKERIAAIAREIGADVLESPADGQVLELNVDEEQLERIASLDDVQWIDPWYEPTTLMDKVRADAGANWVEDNLGYCGEGVRGEVMDAGIQLDHQDFDGILEHGPIQSTDVRHGTSVYGIVFGNGDRDGDGDAAATGQIPCGQGMFALWGPPDRYAHTRELKEAPFLASFQTNSWGTIGATDRYNSFAHELDDIVWRLDFPILHAQGNEELLGSTSQALAKNVISVGGIRHYDTLNPADDAWDFGASIGVTTDGRIKPDVSYWYDAIHTADSEPGGYTPGSTYISEFGGTSAATPQVAGVLGLLLEMWKDNVWGTNHPPQATVFEVQPRFSTLKALLINNAQQYGFSGTDHDLSRYKQGWGRPSVRVAAERAARSFIVDQDVLLQVGERIVYGIDVSDAEPELKITMVYPDPPGTPASPVARVNNLDLTVISPTGLVYHGNVGLTEGNESVPGGSPDGIDTVENVFVVDPEPGVWSVGVEAMEINQDACPVDHDSVCGPTPGGTPESDATFSLVVTGGTHGTCVAPTVDFSFLPNPPRVGDAVQFSSNVTGGAGAPYSYWWDLDGDGVTDSSEPNPVHVYSRPYHGVAKLWVGDAENCPATSSEPVAVSGPDLRFDDLTLAEIEGNGNGGVDPGETWALTVQLHNAGNEPAIGISATLAVDPVTPGLVALLQAGSAYPDLDQGEIAGSDSTYEFRVGEGFPCPAEIVLSLTVSSTDPVNVYPGDAIAIKLGLPRTSLFADGFETDKGWGLTPAGEWEIDVPLGLGGTPPDPTSAFEGERVLGNDLTGLGSFPGEYENNVGISGAESPIIDIAGVSGVELSYQRWLNVSAGDHASLWIVSGPSFWQILDLSDIADEGWTRQTLDLSRFLGDRDALRIVFAIETDGAGTGSGWNIDDLEVSGVSCEHYGPYARYDGIAGVTEIDGNGDSVIDAGETWDLRVNLRNDGSDPARGVAADVVVDPATPGSVAMLQSSSTYPDIDAGQTVTSESAYRLQVGDDFPCGSRIVLSLIHISSSDPPATYPDEIAAIRVETDERATKKLTASDPDEGDRFGDSVSIDGDRVVVGASRNDDDAGDDSGSAYIFRHEVGTGWVEEAKLTAGDAAADDWFGYSVSIDGDRAVIGSPQSADGGGPYAGSAYVFHHHAGGWAEEATLTASDAAPYDFFGEAVSISGDRAVIGASHDDDGGTGSGSVYVFRYDPSAAGWVEEARLTASDAAQGNRFGWAIAIDGDRVVAGANGSAYVFRYDSVLGEWVEEVKLTPGDVADGDAFGLSVSIRGDRVVVGAKGDDDHGTDSGSAYIFRYDSVWGEWVEEVKLTPRDAAAGDWFGSSVTVSAERVVVGAVHDSGGADESGSAYVFRYDAGTDAWMEEAKLTAYDGTKEGKFGHSVSISGNRTAVGAYDNRTGLRKAGSAYVFGPGPFSDCNRDGIPDHCQPQTDADNDLIIDACDACRDDIENDADGDGLCTAQDTCPGFDDFIDCNLNGIPDGCEIAVRLAAGDEAGSELFGESVSIRGDRAVVGAWGAGANDQDPGAAYVYHFDRATGVWSEMEKLTPAGAAKFDHIGYSVSIDGNWIVVGAPGDDDRGDGSGAVYVFRYDEVDGWIEDAKLRPPDLTPSDYFGTSVSISGDAILVGAPTHDVGGNADSGAAYLFRRDPLTGTWAQSSKLTAGDGDEGDRFGWSVSIGGDLAAVGAYFDDDGAVDAGAVYVFAQDPVDESWLEQAKLLADDPAAGDQFGFAVSIRGVRVIAGAPFDDDGGTDAGSAYVFVRSDSDTGIWVEESKLQASDSAPGDRFGHSVSIDFGELVIGAPFHDSDGSDAGSAYVFRTDRAGWFEFSKLAAGDAAPNDQFGSDVSIDGERFLIGSNRSGDTDSGAAYVYHGPMTSDDCDDDGSPDECQADTDSDGAIDSCDADDDDDGVPDAEDCASLNGGVWSIPGEVRALVLSRDPLGAAALAWQEPVEPGGSVVYDTLRADLPDGFMSASSCMESGDGTDTTALDEDSPASGDSFYYLIRAENLCGAGSLGTSSSGSERVGQGCP